MKHRYALGLLLALSLVSSVPRAHAETPRVILSEIAWAGSAKSTADEWIELANLEGIPVSLSGWKLTGVGTSGSPLLLPDGATIAAGGTYLVANYKVGSSSTLLATPDYVTTAVSIPNTALNVSLLDHNGAVIDTLIDPGTPNAGSSTSFASMERVLSDASWATAEVSTNLPNDQFGSPGVAGHKTAPLVEVVPTLPAEIPSMEPSTPPVGETAPATPVVTESSSTSTPEGAATVVPGTPDPAPVSEAPVETPIASTPSVPTETPTSVETPAVTESEVVPNIPTTTEPAQTSDPIVPEIPTEATIEPTPSSDEPVVHVSTLAITGFLAAPNTGEDEWIEIANTGTNDIDLSTYVIVDASGKATTLSGVIAAGSTVVITDPKGALNNDGDTIAILDAAGSTVAQIVYGTDEFKAPKKHVVMRYIDGAWGAEETTEVVEAPVASTSVEANETATASDAAPVQTSEVSSPSTETPSIDVAVEVSTPSSEAIPESSTIELMSEDTPSTSDSAASSSETILPPPSSVTIGDLVISALLPAPATGDEEWIAITNTTNASIDLSTVSVSDASGAATTLSGAVEAGETVYITNPKGKLNNDGDTVSLLSSGSVLDAVTYGTDDLPTPKKGETIFFSPTLTYETDILETPTTTDSATTTRTSSSPRRTSTHENAVASTSTTTSSAHSVTPTAPRISASSSTRSTSRSSSSKSTAPKAVSIDGIDQIADDTSVTLEGIVVATAGSIGKRSFFLDGLEIYQSQGTLANVSIGDRVRVSGTVSVLSDHRRVNIKEGGVTVLGTATPVTHEYGNGLKYGSLTRATGTVSARSGNGAILALDNGSSLTLSAASGVSVNWSDFAGKRLTAVGILKSTSDKTTLVLRNAEDLVVETTTTGDAPASAGTTAPSFPWIGTSLALLTSAGLGFWFWKTRPTSAKSLTLKPSHV